MDNPHTFPVDFEWVPSSAIFTVTPSSGTIPPKSAAEIAVRWQPGSGASSQAQDGHMTLKLKEGAEAPMRVHLHGELPAGVLKFKERELNLGPVPVGVPQTVVVQIKNSGAGDAAYRVCTVWIACKCTAPRVLDDCLCCSSVHLPRSSMFVCPQAVPLHLAKYS